MSRKDKISITHSEEFSEIENELMHAMDGMDEANLKIETLLQTHVIENTPPGYEDKTESSEKQSDTANT